MTYTLVPPETHKDMPCVTVETSDTEPVTVTLTVGTVKLPALDQTHFESLYNALNTLVDEVNAARKAPVDKLEESADTA